MKKTLDARLPPRPPETLPLFTERLTNGTLTVIMSGEALVQALSNALRENGYLVDEHTHIHIVQDADFTYSATVTGIDYLVESDMEASR